MHVHTPSQFEGPLTRGRSWWKPFRGKSSRQQRRTSQAPIRQELVDRVRREIKAGTYDTPEKLEIALERLLNRLSRQ